MFFIRYGVTLICCCLAAQVMAQSSGRLMLVDPHAYGTSHKVHHLIKNGDTFPRLISTSGISAILYQPELNAGSIAYSVSNGNHQTDQKTTSSFPAEVYLGSLQAGDYTITIQLFEGLNQTGMLLKTERFQFKVKDFEKDKQAPFSAISRISVYPNPSTGTINLKTENTEGEIEIINTFNQQIGLIKAESQVINLPPGVYILKYKQGDMLITEKILVK
ncbi:T9SS type A sorting domain-containing protein [Limibacter armeniacum]|uniref:T9SS type A sorting domain-containing protein n=1 Tax=Limibacter armeniacum TaxID=466084 RepID=UPI002FE6C43D